MKMSMVKVMCLKTGYERPWSGGGGGSRRAGSFRCHLKRKGRRDARHFLKRDLRRIMAD